MGVSTVDSNWDRDQLVWQVTQKNRPKLYATESMGVSTDDSNWDRDQ